MKKFAFAILILSLSQFSMANDKKICEKLNDEAHENCIESMCEDFGDDCQSASDFGEALQMCMEDEFPSVLDAYNKKNPRKKVKCEDF